MNAARGIIVALALSARADADPLRLRADALATTQAPAGLITLEATASDGPALSAEALVWTGDAGTADAAPVDVLVIALRARTADGRASARIGRFVETLGALRPEHVDGGAGRVRLPYAVDVEAFAGIPVEPDLATSRSWDWVAGGRVARRLGDFGSLGVAYLQRRDEGRLAREEFGVDAGAALTRRDDLGARFAYDLANPGVAEASATASHRQGALRVEAYGSYRAASHLVPATSLFSVLGDTPAVRTGGVATWKAAPRLDVSADVAVRYSDTATPAITARAKLALDDRGASALAGELRRDGASDDAWTGARATLRLALPCALTASTELELVIPDHARGRGAVWPWALAAIAWQHGPWTAAFALEADASPADNHRVDALVQLGRRWEVP